MLWQDTVTELQSGADGKRGPATVLWPNTRRDVGFVDPRLDKTLKLFVQELHYFGIMSVVFHLTVHLVFVFTSGVSLGFFFISPQ